MPAHSTLDKIGEQLRTRRGRDGDGVQHAGIEIGVLVLFMLLPLLVMFGVIYFAVRLAIRHEHRTHGG